MHLLHPRGTPPSTAPLAPGGSRLGLPNAVALGCRAGLGMQDLGCHAGLHIWRRVGVPSRVRGEVGRCPTRTGNKTMAESATAPASASSETQFGPEVPGAACEPCLEHTKPRADCLWISALLPTQTYAGGEKQAASLQVLVQPLALLPLNCHMKAKILKVISAVPSTGWLYSKCRRNCILQRGVGWVLLN